MSDASATHILVLPYPAQGHMLPLLDLTNLLAHRGFKFTIVVTPKNLPILAPILYTHPSIQTLIFPFPPHPKLPPGVEHIRDIGMRANFAVAAALSSLAGPIADWFKAHPSPPQAILSDFFHGWTHNLAQELGIPRIAFYSSGCFLSSVAAVLFSDIARFKELDLVEFTDLPRSPTFKEEHLPSIFRFYDESNPDARLFVDGLVANLSSWGCVFNTFGALEGDYLEQFKNLTVNRRAYGVGPLYLFEESASLTRTYSGHEVGCDLSSWLDDSPDDSVLYVSFGSQKWLTEPQLQALGLALENSGARFIWVVRSGPNASGLDGFEERVAGRGYVVKDWAPQVEILSHRAVGGFLSHCGWNSMLESIVAGVVVLAWPMEADQYVNARLLVKDMRVGLWACDGPDTVPDPNELARVIRKEMAPDTPQRQRAKQLEEEASAAVKDGGTSRKDLDDFVNELVCNGT